MTGDATAPGRSSGVLRHPALALAGLTCLAWLTVALWARLLSILGIEFGEKWFIDSYAILATLDARRAGLDPLAANPLDFLHRAHVYSDWWYGLGWLGLTRQDNFLVGGCWVLGFLGSAIAWLRVRAWRETVLAVLMLASPPVLLAVNRANNDLVIFILLAGAALMLATDRTWRVVVAGLLVAVATGLKFYPAVAIAFVALVRPPSRLGRIAGGLAVLLGLVVANVWSQAGRGVIEMPQDVHKLGTLVLLRDFGCGPGLPQVIAAVLVLAGGAGLAARGWTRGLDSVAVDFRARAGFVIGATVLLACFFTGISFGYRWIFGLLLLPWLWRAGEVEESAAVPRAVVRLTLAMLLFAVWGDGLFCAAINLAGGPLAQATIDHATKIWRMTTQPLQWMLFVLLAGWLWEAGFAAVRSMWRERSISPRVT